MSGSTLPNGWGLAQYQDVYLSASNGVGGTQNKEGTGLPVSRIETIANEYIDYDRVGYLAVYDEQKVEKHRLISGDILFSHINSPAHLGKTAIYDGKHQLFHGINLLRIVVDRRLILPSILNYHCKYIRALGDFSAQAQHAVNQSSLNQKKLGMFNIPLPTLVEQNIIANKLDDFLARVESIKTRLENIPEILKKFRQSVLIAAVSGRLNSKHYPMKSIHVGYGWPHEIEGPAHWVEYKFSDVIKIVGGSQPPKSEFSDVCLDGYIRLIQIRDYKSDNHKVFIHRDKAKRLVYKDDVMIGRYGPPIFQILRGLEGAYNVALMKAVPNQELLRNDYLYWYLQNFNILNYVEAGSDRTAGQSGVNKKHLEAYPMLIPSLAEQDEIVKSLEVFFSYANSIELKVTDALNNVNHLTQSILGKAFRGELTAQWREENPEMICGINSVEVLLEKISAEKLTTGVIKKRTKKAAH